MKVAITGAAGFIGWHARCALHAAGIEFTSVDHGTWDDPTSVARALRNVDAVLHLAGANRGHDQSVREGNLAAAQSLTDALERADRRPVIIYANSVHAGDGTPYGEGKQAAADHLTRWASDEGAVTVDVRLPNLFGEHGRPHYNSVVATFCCELANGGMPTVDHDRDLPLMHVQDAVQRLLDATTCERSAVVVLEARRMPVGEVLDLLSSFHDAYVSGDIPDVSDPLHLALFNTYRSFTFPHRFPIRPPVRTDSRGALFECVRARTGEAQVFCSTTRPGATRGDHFHLRKLERFLVLDGQAEIAVRRLFDDAIVRFNVSGDDPAIVDMPTMWAHSITNTGATPLTTMFWTNQIFDPGASDTYFESVHRAA
jgi:UDP-2-acetamido-2,6-beta-L-arabino-hexul-4-ose reductase